MTVTVQEFGDMSEEFDFDDEAMEYADGPMSGWLHRKRDGAWFAYDCQMIVAEKLWHWTLVPVARRSDDVARVLAEAAQGQGGEWLSIVEDRRASAESHCRAVAIGGAPALPVRGGADARSR